jgi:hypothetical protein
MLSGFKARLVRVLHSHPSWALRSSAYEEGPNPIRSRMRNMVSLYRSPKGSRSARGSDGDAGKGWRKKQKPCCNGADTGSGPGAKAGRLPPGLPSQENLANRPHGVSR